MSDARYSRIINVERKVSEKYKSVDYHRDYRRSISIINSRNRYNKTILYTILAYRRLSPRLVTSYARRSLPMLAIFLVMQSYGPHYDVIERLYDKNDSLITIGLCRTRALACYCHICRHAPELSNKRWTYRLGNYCL